MLGVLHHGYKRVEIVPDSTNNSWLPKVALKHAFNAWKDEKKHGFDQKVFQFSYYLLPSPLHARPLAADQPRLPGEVSIDLAHLPIDLGNLPVDLGNLSASASFTAYSRCRHSRARSGPLLVARGTLHLGALRAKFGDEVPG